MLSWFWGLVGDECVDESAEYDYAEAGREHDVSGDNCCLQLGFGLVVHGFGV